MEQKCFDLRSLSPALSNLWLLLVLFSLHHIDPTLTLHRPHIDPTFNLYFQHSFVNSETMYPYHQQQIFIVIPPPSPPHFYCFPSPTTTTFLLFSLLHHHHHHISIVFPPPSPPHFYCFPSTTTTSTFLLFSLLHHHHHHISIVFPPPPPPHFYCSLSTTTTTITAFLLFSQIGRLMPFCLLLPFLFFIKGGRWNCSTGRQFICLDISAVYLPTKEKTPLILTDPETWMFSDESLGLCSYELAKEIDSRLCTFGTVRNKLCLQLTHRPFPSCLKPLFQNEAKFNAIDMKMIFFYSHANKTHSTC